MRKAAIKRHFFKVVFCWFVVFSLTCLTGCGSGGSGGSGGVATPVTSGGTIYGRITAPPGLSLGLRMQTPGGNAVARALVWLENNPGNTALTDENGYFTLTNVPYSAPQRIISRYDLATTGELFLYRSEPISLSAAESFKQLNELQLSKGLYSISGILKDQLKQPVANARLVIWGIEFKSDANGRFNSPPLPESAEIEQLKIYAQGFKEMILDLPVLRSNDQQVFFDISLSGASEPNIAPVPYFANIPAQTTPGQRIAIELKVIDPDELLSNYFKPKWSSSAGDIETTADPLKIFWTAPQTAGLATISARVTDSRNAEGIVDVGIAVGGIKTAVLRVTAIEPAAAGVGSRISLKGSGFGEDKSQIQISFNGTAAVVHEVSDGEILTEVPAGATTGLLLLIKNEFEKSAGIFTVTDSDISLSPSYGPPGTSIAISGKDFGLRKDGSQVQVNGNAATIISWSDSEIIATVPEGTTSGVVNVQIGEKNRLAGFFRVTRVFEISSITTSVGASITISGEGWGSAINGSTLSFAGPAAAIIDSWSDEKIVLKVPAGAITGELTATIHQVSFKVGDFAVNSILGLSQDLVITGDEVEISGVGFGDGGADSAVLLGSIAAEIISWSDRLIRIRVPEKARPGQLAVNNKGHLSNSRLLEVLGITALSHQRRPLNSILTISGHGFGTETGFVLFGEEVASNFTSWKDDEIKIKVPDSITGQVAIKVSRRGVRSNALPFIAAEITGIDESEGWVGREIIVTGKSLGDGTSGDKVSFNGLAAPIISWQDEQIRVRVPVNATTGPVSIVIGDWPVVLADEFEIIKEFDYDQLFPNWSGPRVNSRPLLTGVARDDSGNTFVTDFDNGWVWKITSSGEQSKFGNFANPWGLAFNYLTDELFVVDSGNNTIKVFDSNSNLLRSVGSYGNGNGEFNNPRGIFISSTGMLFVADSGNNRIQVFAADGNYLSEFGSYGSSPGQFISPSAVALDGQANLYVADAGNHRIQRFSPDNLLSPTSWAFSAWLGARDPNTATPGWLTTGTGLASSRNGGFNNPYGCGISGNGKLLVADTNNNRLQVFTTSSGQFENLIGAAGITSGQYNQPLAVLPLKDEDAALIADSSNARIQRSNFDGSYIDQLAPDTSRLNTRPGRIAIDSERQRVYVLDIDDGSITVYNVDGEVVQIIGSSGSGREQFYQPEGMALDSNGTLFVADTGNARIQRISASGVFEQSWGIYGIGAGQFQRPNALCLSSDNQYIFVTDSSLNRVQKFTRDGELITFWGSQGSGDDEFNFPAGIACDRNDNLYIVDRDNHRVKKYDTSGNFIGWWGSYDAGAQAFWLDPGSNRTGALSDADGGFDTPTDVAVDIENKVYITDTNNFRIQVFSAEQSTAENAGFQTDIYVGEKLTALGVDLWSRVYCIDSGGLLLRYAPAP